MFARLTALYAGVHIKYAFYQVQGTSYRSSIVVNYTEVANVAEFSFRLHSANCYEVNIADVPGFLQRNRQERFFYRRNVKGSGFSW